MSFFLNYYYLIDVCVIERIDKFDLNLYHVLRRNNILQRAQFLKLSPEKCDWLRRIVAMRKFRHFDPEREDFVISRARSSFIFNKNIVCFYNPCYLIMWGKKNFQRGSGI